MRRYVDLVIKMKNVQNYEVAIGKQALCKRWVMEIMYWSYCNKILKKV